MLLGADTERMRRLDEKRKEGTREGKEKTGMKALHTALGLFTSFLKANVFFLSTTLLLINTVICGLKISISNLELE